MFHIFQIYPGPETFLKYFLKHLKYLNISNIRPALNKSVGDVGLHLHEQGCPQ